MYKTNLSFSSLFAFSAQSNEEIWGKALPQVAPSENECRPYIEKAIKQLTTDGTTGNY